MNPISEHYFLESRDSYNVLHLISADQMNRLSQERVLSLTALLEELSRDEAGPDSAGRHKREPLIVTGNEHYFSVGADLNQIAQLYAPAACEFAKIGQRLMQLVDNFPALVYGAVSGYCMGGGLDLALACDIRICSANAIFGHRGAALGLITGWGGTQRLPRIVGRPGAIKMFAAAEKLGAAEALGAGLVSEIASDPLARCRQLASSLAREP